MRNRRLHSTASAKRGLPRRTAAHEGRERAPTDQALPVTLLGRWPDRPRRQAKAASSS